MSKVILLADGAFGRWLDHMGGNLMNGIQFSLVQSLSHILLFVTPWTAARQASLSITNSRSSPKPWISALIKETLES